MLERSKTSSVSVSNSFVPRNRPFSNNFSVTSLLPQRLPFFVLHDDSSDL